MLSWRHREIIDDVTFDLCANYTFSLIGSLDSIVGESVIAKISDGVSFFEFGRFWGFDFVFLFLDFETDLKTLFLLRPSFFKFW